MIYLSLHFIIYDYKNYLLKWIFEQIYYENVIIRPTSMIVYNYKYSWASLDYKKVFLKVILILLNNNFQMLFFPSAR